jgi:hypothetical protein
MWTLSFYNCFNLVFLMLLQVTQFGLYFIDKCFVVQLIEYFKVVIYLSIIITVIAHYRTREHISVYINLLFVSLSLSINTELFIFYICLDLVFLLMICIVIVSLLLSISTKLYISYDLF